MTERPLPLDSPGQLVASILAKKVAAGSTHLLVDIPMGPTAKVRHQGDALRLRKLFEFVGDSLGMHLEVLLTDGSQPIGRGIGPVLETRDVLQVLSGDPEAPPDLREKALLLAGHILEFDPGVRGGAGRRLAEEILVSGRASAKMQAIIEAQGRNPEPPSLGRLRHEVPAPVGGVVTAIDNLQIARIARLVGAPMDQGAGVDLFKKLGDSVQQGETLYAIYAEFPADFRCARATADQDTGYAVGQPRDQTGDIPDSLGPGRTKSSHAGGMTVTERRDAARSLLVLGFPDYAVQARALAAAADFDYAEVELHRFPDGETLVRLPAELPSRVVFCRSLDRPNEKLVELCLAARTARSLGVERIWSTNSIPHPTNRLSLAPLLASALQDSAAA